VCKLFSGSAGPESVHLRAAVADLTSKLTGRLPATAGSHQLLATLRLGVRSTGSRSRCGRGAVVAVGTVGTVWS